MFYYLHDMKIFVQYTHITLKNGKIRKSFISLLVNILYQLPRKKGGKLI